MSFPNVPNITPTISLSRVQVVNLLLASIAMEELSLAHIENAEAEKIQAVIGTLPGVAIPNVSLQELIAIDESVRDMLRDVIKKEMLLQLKLEEVLRIPTTSSTTTQTTTSTSTSTTTTETTTSMSTSTTITETTTSTTSTTASTTTSPTPAIEVEKEVSPDGVTWYDADTPPGPSVPPNPYFRFTVTNTGNVTLTNVQVTDSEFTFDPPLTVASLAPGSSYQWRGAVADPLEPGQHQNTATATGEYNGSTVTASDSAYYVVEGAAVPAIEVEKEVSPDGVTWYDADTPPGPSVPPNPQFRFTVTNTGNVTLTNVQVTDNVFTFTPPFTVASLAPGAQAQAIATLASPLSPGQHQNTATATGEYNGSTVTASDSANYFVFIPSAYVTNQDSGTVSVINTTTNNVDATVAVGSGPWGVAVTPDRTKVYVANTNSNTVSVINTATNQVDATVTVGLYPFGVAVTPDGTKVYVTNQHANSVSVINTSTNTVDATVPVGASPVGVAFTPDGTKAYVTNQQSNSVSVINTATNTVDTTISVGFTPFGVAISPDGTKAYVANYASGTVSVINTATNNVDATVSGVSTPRWVAISPDGTKAYVTNEFSNTVSVINTATNNVDATVPVGVGPMGVAITPDGTKAYVANRNYSSNSVSVINTVTNQVVANVPVGLAPTGVAVS